jgi:hypothetical protein
VTETPPTPMPDTPDADTAASTPLDAPVQPSAAVPPLNAAEMLKQKADSVILDIKKSLEYAIIGKKVTVKVKGKQLTFVKWGLSKKLSLGSKVVSLINRVKSFIPAGAAIEDGDNTFFVQIVGYLAEDIIDIISQSMDSTLFKTPAEAAAWIDDECDLNDLFDLCVVVYDTNFPKGEDLGKQTEGLNLLQGKIQSLLK